MKSLLLAVCLLCGGTAFAAEPSPMIAGYRLSPSGVLLLTAATGYFDLKTAEKKAAVERAAAKAPSASVLSVESAGEGELWSVAAGSAAVIDSWSEHVMRFGPRSRRAGRWFGYLGGQLTRGGDLPSNAWTGRLGTTLFKNRYDAAVSLTRNSFTEVDDSGVTTVGLTFRALYPYTAHAGFNLGVQLDRVSATGYSRLSPSALAGINIYLPGGSFDVTLTHGERGNRGLMAGYTVYLGGAK
jgi:hypothetical protein